MFCICSFGVKSWVVAAWCVECLHVVWPTSHCWPECGFSVQRHDIQPEWAHTSVLFPVQILWTFSIYLESVAILPQLFMISKTGEAETITTHYLFFLGLYRALYLINWIWRFYFEGFFDMIAIVAGVVQTILYCDFFYLYVTKGECCCLSFPLLSSLASAF